MPSPDRNVSRRAFLTGLTVLSGAAVFPAVAGGTPVLRQAPDAGAGLIRNPEFGNGVMAGVPRTDGATLWTRVGAAGGSGSASGSLGTGSLSTGSLGSAGGAGGELALIVSRREDLSSPVLAERVQVREDADGTVHFDANGLAPGETYYYQFRGNGSESPVGRFRTLRPADSNEPVRIGWFTCQGFEEGYYAAHRHLAEEDLDFVVCLGDYVYEFTKPGVRGVETNAYPQTIDGMREKYRKYRTDADLRLMHSRHAFLPIWDDHEFRNNYSKDGWKFPVVSDIDGAVGFQQKKQWAWQSWFDHMPVPRFANDPTRTYRSLRVGRTVELFAPDVRQYRDRQACGGPLDHIVCADADAPVRSMLGAPQKRWLLDSLTGSDARWKVVANANMMMGMVVADDGTRASMDTWDGYGAERAEILSTAAQSVENLVLVTGDDHDGYAGELWDTGFAPNTPSGAQANAPGSRRAGVEFVVPSVTSTNTGDGGYTGSSGDAAGSARAEEANRRDHNPHVKHVDMISHGYGLLDVNAGEARFHFRAVDKLNPNSGVATSKSVRTPAGQAVIEPA
ncbi:alkaline phosphatase D family protein [Rhodococcus sp. NPDC055112]